MPKTIPPLRALVAFEATIRHGSFKQAAKELNITPGAVSQQILKLEAWLGYPLFIRQVRRIKATERGMSYFSLIAPALEQISSASENSRAKAENKVALSLTQTLASKWLAPRLESFVSQNPNIEVHINATNSPVDFYSDQIDLAIRHFDGNDPNLESQLVVDDEIRLYSSPDYKQSRKLDNVEDLVNATLLVTTVQPLWDQWFEKFTTLSVEQRSTINTIHFDQTLLSIDGAKRSQGLVLANEILVQEELKYGELIELFPYRLKLNKNYYLVHPKHQRLNQAVLAFKEWLLEQFSI